MKNFNVEAGRFGDMLHPIPWQTEFSALKFKKATGFGVGTDQINFDGDSIFSEFNPHSSFTALAVGYNKVKYLSDGYYLYKYTQRGKSERIFEELGVEGSTHINCYCK